MGTDISRTSEKKNGLNRAGKQQVQTVITSKPRRGTMPNTKSTPQTAPLESKPYPVVNHWVTRDAITESIVYGTEVVALCGDRFVVNGQGGGQVTDAKGVICPLCGSIYDTLRLPR